jgi:hypothetical protein
MKERLYEILNQCTVQVRVGDVVKHEKVGALDVTTFDAMPSEADLVDNLKVIDMILLKVGVDPVRAAAVKDEFVGLIEPLRPMLESGPSYIAIGGELGDQGAAFQFMALGEVLGLWKVVTPRTLGMADDAAAKNAAGIGYVMISGYRQ